MYPFTRNTGRPPANREDRAWPASPVVLEGLEDRRLMSASPAVGFGFGGRSHDGGRGLHARGASIKFGQAPSDVRACINTLATAQGLTAPTDATVVYLGNSGGVETYSVLLAGTGTTTRLTVDVDGNAVTAPTRATTTFGALDNAAVTDGITAIAAALGLSAPVDATPVAVSTPATGAATYSVTLAPADTTAARRRGGATITVDAGGNPVGNQRLPLSTLPAVVQTGLTANAPSGATALAATSIVTVRTLNGVTTYSATYSGTGTQTTVTVDASGALADLPSTSSVTFSTLPVAAQTELQELATADGVAGTIAPTQSLNAYDEANGTTVYSIRLVATGTNSDGSTYTYPVTLSVNRAGNATVPPTGGLGGGVFGAYGFGPGDFDFGGGHGRGGGRGRR